MGLQRILNIPAAYRMFTHWIGKDCRAAHVRDYLRVQPGERVLDLGCGPADILAYLPPCAYFGIDIDRQYIEAAQAKYGARGTFLCQPVEDFVLAAPASFDLVMANGVLHHLNDAQASALLHTARLALKPGGRLVTLDGCFVPGQPWLAKLLLRMDRGDFIRTEPAYRQLAQTYFDDVTGEVRHNLLKLPYTLMLMTCKRRAA